ncbi:MAG: efflux RND transporter periplasmic adaptor subunit [Candidatus Cloacimonetes bacterium]|nr:efflux RND transporter periplasmic adaptor subunit [Candidatus Cloacimonadota bacterium]
MKRIWILVLASVVMVAGCGKKGAEIGPKKVKSYEVTTGNIMVKLEETGEIQPISDIDVKSKVSGKIQKFYVEEGDYIKKGDLIADIEPDYNQAQTISNVKDNLELAEITLANSKRDLAHKEQLAADGFISVDELDSYRDNLRKAEIGYQSALKQYELIKEIETEGNTSKLIATASGTVIQKLVDEGEMVVASTSSFSEGTVVLKLADLTQMIVTSRINEVDISKIHKNQRAEIKVDAFPYESYRGKIQKIAAMAVTYSNVKVFPIEILLDEVDEKLRPGMTANITIIGEERDSIVVVPIRCLFADEDGNDVVYRVKSDTISTMQPVKTGINNFQKVEIVDGLAVGDTISFSEPTREVKIDENVFN